jgi:hypothetical protein
MPLLRCPRCKRGPVEWLSTFGEPPREDYYRCVACRHVWSIPRQQGQNTASVDVPGVSKSSAVDGNGRNRA